MRCFIYWRYLSYAAAANNDSYFIDNQELQLSSDSKFVEGIIFDDNDAASSPESLSGFDLVMSLGSTVEDTGLDLMRGNNESSDEENRRLRKLNQDPMRPFNRVGNILNKMIDRQFNTMPDESKRKWKDRYEKSFERMQAAYENCGRGGSAGDFPEDKLFDFGALGDRENPCKLLPEITKGVTKWIDHFLFGCKVQRKKNLQRNRWKKYCGLLKSFYGCRNYDEEDFKKPLVDLIWDNKVRPDKDSGYVEDSTYVADDDNEGTEDTTEDTTDTTQTTTPYKHPSDSSIVCVTSPCITN